MKGKLSYHLKSRKETISIPSILWFLLSHYCHRKTALGIGKNAEYLTIMQQSWTILYQNVSIARTYTKIGCFMNKYDLFANNSITSSPNLFGLSIGTHGEWHHGLSFFEKERFHGDIESKRERILIVNLILIYISQITIYFYVLIGIFM